MLYIKDILLYIKQISIKDFLNPKKRNKVIIRSDVTGRKICVCRFTNQEYETIVRAAAYAGETIEEFFMAAIRQVANRRII